MLDEPSPKDGTPQPLSDRDVNATLTRIFQKIGTRDQTKQVEKNNLYTYVYLWY